ncbi:hypothetical protein BpHYR1_033101 [Brachionus plicatilis]|uniref:Uncharacterized protein n=1 Tax=Brachionus plicatilis TaxID=10195 RepID=A0A3M7PBM6_BRAPC|nr:hypothetical protein BpHYR1_033101 [Brachionus plicatilis]
MSDSEYRVVDDYVPSESESEDENQEELDLSESIRRSRSIQRLVRLPTLGMTDLQVPTEKQFSVLKLVAVLFNLGDRLTNISLGDRLNTSLIIILTITVPFCSLVFTKIYSQRICKKKWVKCSIKIQNSGLKCNVLGGKALRLIPSDSKTS